MPPIKQRATKKQRAADPAPTLPAARMTRPAESSTKQGVYFKRKALKYISTGCTVFNCVVSGHDGGWPLGRVVNIVGDKSAGKTLCAIEAAANFHRVNPKGKIFYREAEACFDLDFAESLGLPVDAVDFGPEGPDTVWDTIEAVFEDLKRSIALCKKSGQPGLYIIDSLDALSSDDELELDIRAGTYGTEKAKKMSRLFRQLIRGIKQANMCLLVISQIRDKIGAMVRGDKYVRSGGKALDFYAAVVVYLAHIERLVRTVDGVKRPTGIVVKAVCKKNKIALPFRDCTFPIKFMYGIDDVEASLEWLESVKRLKGSGFDGKDPIDETKLREYISTTWFEIEKSFAPEKRKYE